MKLRTIPLGGVEEVGKNCMALELLRSNQKQGDIIVIDMGLDFPNPDLLGVDYVLPDVAYLEKNKNRIKGLVITHGHLDHIGAIPYFLKRLGDPPIFATPLTIGLIEDRLLEFGIQDARFNVIKPEKTFNLGDFSITPFAVVHNIPDSVGLIIKTPLGTIVHTGDFKFDRAPVDQKPVNEKFLEKIGDDKVLALLSDSTNAALPGKVVSEQEVGQITYSLIKGVRGRIIFTTFASLISRIQQAINACQKCNRKVALVGMSVKKTVAIAQSLGYLKIPHKMIVDITELNKMPPYKVFIIAGGSQGVEGSSMDRIAQNIHRLVRIKQGDTVIFSSSTVPGNEISVTGLMNGLVDQGAEVIFRRVLGSGIHSSGHAKQEGLLKMISLIRPKFFMPIEGAHYMQAEHIKLAQSSGIKKENCFMLKNGEVLEFNEQSQARKLLRVRMPHSIVVVEGQKIEPLNEKVLKVRKKLAESGICFVSISAVGPSKKVKSAIKINISCQGIELSDELISNLKNKTKKLIQRYGLKSGSEHKMEVSLSDLILSRAGKKPMVTVLI
ncbi:hypothetical protein B6D52_03380 [Candidatus Parcubacteria bacterium 4484_255]|nr:MAG: hypothetical protein B6D52_03380 [Candidatus Parcubacteria bacterium 4484_255]